MPAHRAAPFALLATVAACSVPLDAGSNFDTEGASTTGTGDTDTDGETDTGSATDSQGGTSSGTTIATTGDASSGGSTGDDPKYDVGGSDLNVGGCDPNDPNSGNCTCDAVDILFVIDSSGSMGDEQVALGQAFPQFIDAIVTTLPAGVNVHVGVTTTEMSPGGLYAVTFPCNGEKPDWYMTPDVMDSGVNGAQGRLYQVPNEPTYAEFETDASQAELQMVSDWFVQAAMVGTDGSSEEMSLAGAGWALDPINDATNTGFIRDKGAALVVFFVTDEDDQTPIAGGEAQGLIDTIAAAKTQCGGLDCVAAGGVVREQCLDQDAMGMFFDALDPSHVTYQDIPYNTMNEASLFVDVLEQNLTQIIDDLCKSIPPAG